MDTALKYELYLAFLDDSLTIEERVIFDDLMLDVDNKQSFEDFSLVQKEYGLIMRNQEKEKDFIENLKAISISHKKNAINNDSDAMIELEPNQLKINNSKSRIFTISRPIKAAMAATVFIIAGLFIFKLLNNGKHQNPQELFASHYKNEVISLERGAVADSFAKIANLYNAKQYKEALPLIAEYLKSNPNNYNLQLASALCYLETNNFNESENSLKNIINVHNEFEEKAQWYLAMLYLKKGQINTVSELLKSFSKEHFYFDKAQKILKGLE